MTYYIGIDGGGTKTKFLLCDQKGIILAEDIQPTSHYFQCGLDGLATVIETGITNILTNTKLQPSDIATCFAAIPGYGDIEDDNEKIENAVLKGMKNIKFEIGNDTDNGLAGSLAGQPGINIIAGTGSIGLGLNKKGETLRCGGWHHIFGGDEGSAYWLACKMILEFTRQSDGRDEKTPLYFYLKEALNLNNDSDILVRTITEMEFDRTKIAKLASYLSELAKQEDKYALLFYKEAAKELFDIINTIRLNLNMDKEETSVSYSGGVFKSGRYILEPLADLFGGMNVKIVAPILPPDAGSLLLALKLDNIPLTNEIIENLKSYY